MAAKAGSNISINKTHDALLEALRNPSNQTAGHVLKLKKRLSTKERTLSFISDNPCVFRAILEALKVFINKLTVVGSNTDDVNYMVLIKELISLVANCCHFSISCSVAINEYTKDFATGALQILESGDRTDSAVKASMLRLLGNVAEYRETASIVAHSSLLDRVAIMISIEDTTISDAALRTVRILSKHRFYLRHIVNASVCLNIGLLLAKRELPAILKNINPLVTLEQICKIDVCIRDVGRQLGQGQCAERILEIVFARSTGIVKRWQSLILKLTKRSCDFREILGRKAIVEIVSQQKVNRCIILFLCQFARDVCRRRDLRIDGAIPVILQRLSEAALLEEKSQIIEALKFFIYDPEGLAIVCHQNEVTNLCIESMNYILNNVKRTHADKPEAYFEEDQMENAARGELTPARTNFIQEKHSNPQFWRYTISSPSSCPSMSPTSNFSLSPNPATSPLRTIDDILMLSQSVEEEETNQPANKQETSSNKSDELNQSEIHNATHEHLSIIADCIEIFLWRTYHEEEGAKLLIEESTLRTFLLFLSEVSFNAQDRHLRLLIRLTKSRLQLNTILKFLPVMTTIILIRQPCLLKRFCSPCSHCSERTRYGLEILTELIAQTDGPFGIGILEQHCSFGGDSLIHALLNGLVLLRLKEHSNRFIQRWKPVQTVLKRVSDILVKENTDSIMDNELLIEIFAMLSLLVPRRLVHKLIGPAEPYREEFNDECTLETPADDEPQIEFSTNDGGHMISIRTEDLSKTNSYFRGMIRHELKTTQKLSFVFDQSKDDVDEQDFLIFLHYLSGCREKNCVRIHDAKSCISLLHLSDKYSCLDLAEELVRSNGPGRRLIDGCNIAEFVPVVLPSRLYRDRMGYVLSLVFFKYTTKEQQRQVFSVLAGNQMGVDYFVELISNFLDTINVLNGGGYSRALPIDFI